MNNLNLSIKNEKTKKLVNITLCISHFICILGIIILYLYNTYYISKYLYTVSIVLFRTGLFSGTFSIICGIFFENYLGC